MNADVKAKWVEALRSGRYKQGFEKLRSAGDEFCCLGVLCDIVDGDRWHRAFAATTYMHDNLYGLPPKHVQDTAGINENIVEDLVLMNDGNAATFHEIAEYIEANL